VTAGITYLTKRSAVLAVDRRITQDGAIVSDSAVKYVDCRTHIAIFAGDFGQIQTLMRGVATDSSAESATNRMVAAATTADIAWESLVYDTKAHQLQLIGSDGCVIDMPVGAWVAIGSGGGVARGFCEGAQAAREELPRSRRLESLRAEQAWLDRTARLAIRTSSKAFSDVGGTPWIRVVSAADGSAKRSARR
jgi:hypothetical protein